MLHQIESINMKACSFLPAATQMIYDMNLQHLLHGVTFECPLPAREEKNKVVRCILEGNTYSSIEIDRIFSASKASGKSLYYVDDNLLHSIAPDVIFTQDVCEVCQIDTVCTAAAVAVLPRQPQLVTITPQSLSDVFHSAITIAKTLGAEEDAYTYIAALQSRMDTVIDTLRAHKALPKRVSLLEWTEPLYNCGHWIPHQIAYAGGVDMLSNPSGDSMVLPWEKLLRYNPEVLIIAPCGYDVARTLHDMPRLTNLPGWNEMDAVRANHVYIADYDVFTQPSASTLVDGIEILAACFHPQICSVPKHLRQKVHHFSNIAAYV